MSKRKQLNRSELAAKIKTIVPSTSFKVHTKTEQEQACQVARSLEGAGVIGFKVITRREGNGSVISGALPPQEGNV